MKIFEIAAAHQNKVDSKHFFPFVNKRQRTVLKVKTRNINFGACVLRLRHVSKYLLRVELEPIARNARGSLVCSIVVVHFRSTKIILGET